MTFDVCSWRTESLQPTLLRSAPRHIAQCGGYQACYMVQSAHATGWVVHTYTGHWLVHGRLWTGSWLNSRGLDAALSKGVHLTYSIHWHESSPLLIDVSSWFLSWACWFRFALIVRRFHSIALFLVCAGEIIPFHF